MEPSTPMMEQYQDLKRQHPDAILLFRLGDFYEMFFEDAVLASRELELTLTGRDGGKALGRVPMCGVPYHSVQGYLQRLLEKGYRVAICEQVEDPRLARGLVRREVTRVLTPGTIADPALLDERRATFVCALCSIANPSGGAGTLTYGLATADASTGEFAATEVAGPDARSAVLDELGRLQPAEITYDPGDVAVREVLDVLRQRGPVTLTARPAAEFEPLSAAQCLLEHWRVPTLRGFGLDEFPAATAAAGAAFGYLRETQKAELAHFTGVHVYDPGQYLVLDPVTRRNLELTRRLSDGRRNGTLLEALDKTMTAMGARALRAWLERPLRDVERIRARLDAVQFLFDDGFLRQDLRAALRRVHDLERLTGRFATGSANARDLVALAASLRALPACRALPAGAPPLLLDLAGAIDPLPDLAAHVEAAIAEDAPVALQEGGLIRPGFHPEVDRLRELTQSGRRWIAALEDQERQRTGIKSLKIGYNKVFGYYIEVTRSNLPAVPVDFIRKQTLANGERYVTPELKEREVEISSAEERLAALEFELFCAVRAEAAAQAPALQATARATAALDVLCALAEVAQEQGYQRPVVDDGDEIEIRDGRHPVVELNLGRNRFVPNDVRCNGSDRRLLIVTGPNMGGKSTYLRQTALITLLAQAGGFVPASFARIGVADRIFTRVGASDDVGGGLSTFMVEMTETAAILHAATPRSLVLLDEIGRGTSTFDGLAIAWAVAERIADPSRNGARALFATHYHELTELESWIPGVVNGSVAVRERGEELVFLHRIIAGGADRSYGIQVARLAGLPRDVIERAREVLAALQRQPRADVFGATGGAAGATAPGGRGDGRAEAAAAAERGYQLTFLEAAPHPVIDELRRLDALDLTPRQALDLIFAWQERIRRDG